MLSSSNAPNLSRSSTLSLIPNPAVRSVVVMGSSQYVQSNGLAAIRRHDPAAGAKSASRKKRAGYEGWLPELDSNQRPLDEQSRSLPVSSRGAADTKLNLISDRAIRHLPNMVATCLPPYFTKDGAAGMKASFRGPARSQSATDIGSFAGMPPSRNEKALAGC
jgi:hypothetical protein